MMMIVDMQKSEKGFDVLAEELEQVGANMGVIVKLQREEIFDKMHRI